MKRKILLVSILLITLFASTIVFATDDLEVKSSVNVNDVVGEDVNYDDLVMPISEEIEEPIKRGDLFILQDNASINNDVDGNVYVMADNVEIEGNIDGNVFAMGTNVTIKSNISGSVFALAENVNFVCGEAKDVYFFGNDIALFDEAVISREAKMMAEKIRISGAIKGDLYSESENIKVTDGAIIEGKLSYSGTLDKANDKQIGKLEKHEMPKIEITKKDIFVAKAESVLMQTVTAFCIIGLIIGITKNSNMEAKITLADVIKGIIAGISWITIIPILLIFLMITIIGLPFALILLMVYILMFFVAIPAMSLQLAVCILKAKNKESKVLEWFLAVLIYCALAILRTVPTLGVAITMLTGTYGFNLILKTAFAKKKSNIEQI